MGARLLLAGYFGAGNMGDDAILLGFVHGLGGADFDVTVLSGSPEETNRQYGFAAIPRRDMRAIDGAIAACDALVFPGGSIFQDATSVRSVYYYSELVRRARAKGKKVILLGQGVGPLRRLLGRRLAARAFRAADAIAVRDPQSLQALHSLGLRGGAVVTADCAFLLPAPAESADGAFNVGSMKTVGIAPRPLRDKGRDVVGLMGEFCRLLYQAGAMPVLVEMDRHEDGPLIQEIAKRQGGKIPDLRRVPTPMAMQQRLARMDMVVAMRLHAGILAATVGVPPLMLSYDPKVAAFAKALDLGSAVGLEGLTATRLLDCFAAFQRDRERNGKLLERKRAELAGLAARNVELLQSTIR